MNSIKRCLICYQPLSENQKLYHPKCSKKFFEIYPAPQLDYSYDGLKELAKNVIKSRITIPGVQSKLSLHLDKSLKKNSRFTIVGLWGNFILKPPVKEFPFMPEIEHLTMHLADYLKINTVPHALIYLKSGEIAYITRRIDRLPSNEKLHMEDMCQLSERLTEDKYRGSMEQIGKIISAFSSNSLFDIIRFFEMILYCFLTGNADMHLKNFSLIYPLKEMIMLAPAYDLISTRLLISEEDDPEESALTINGKKRKLNLKDFHQFGENLGLNSKQISNIFKKFSIALPGLWQIIENSFLQKEKAAEFKQLITNRAIRLELTS